VIACPIPFETLADYWSGEALPDEVEEHLFACAVCSERSGSLASVTTALRQDIPSMISRERVDGLVAAGCRVLDTDVQPGGTERAVFARELDLLIHHLHGDYRSAAHVDCTVLAGDRLLFELERVPFDRQRGEVLVACQRHLMDMGPLDIVFRVTTVDVSGDVRQEQYTVIHERDPRG
jgi:hypothetical protein